MSKELHSYSTTFMGPDGKVRAQMVCNDSPTLIVENSEGTGTRTYIHFETEQQLTDAICGLVEVRAEFVRQKLGLEDTQSEQTCEKSAS